MWAKNQYQFNAVFFEHSLTNYSLDTVKFLSKIGKKLEKFHFLIYVKKSILIFKNV